MFVTCELLAQKIDAVEYQVGIGMRGSDSRGAGWVWVWERLDRYGGHRVDMAFIVVVTAKEGAVAGLGPVFASALLYIYIYQPDQEMAHCTWGTTPPDLSVKAILVPVG